jgi:hypothetical protein
MSQSDHWDWENQSSASVCILFFSISIFSLLQQLMSVFVSCVSVLAFSCQCVQLLCRWTEVLTGSAHRSPSLDHRLPVDLLSSMHHCGLTCTAVVLIITNQVLFIILSFVDCIPSMSARLECTVYHWENFKCIQIYSGAFSSNLKP